MFAVFAGFGDAFAIFELAKAALETVDTAAALFFCFGACEWCAKQEEEHEPCELFCGWDKGLHGWCWVRR